MNAPHVLSTLYQMKFFNYFVRISKFSVEKDFIHTALQVEESRQTPFKSSVMSWMCVHQGNQVTVPGRRKCSKGEGRERSKVYAEKESIIWNKG